MLKKEKTLLVFEAKNGKTMSYDLQTHRKVGVTGKRVVNFSSNYMREFYESDDIYTIMGQAFAGTLERFSLEMIETAISLQSSCNYETDALKSVMKMCVTLDKKLNKKTFEEYSKIAQLFNSTGLPVNSQNLKAFQHNKKILEIEDRNILDLIQTGFNSAPSLGADPYKVMDIIISKQEKILNAISREGLFFYDANMNNKSLRCALKHEVEHDMTYTVKYMLLEYIVLGLELEQELDFRYIVFSLNRWLKMLAVKKQEFESEYLTRDKEKLLFENDNFLVVVPENHDDVKREGDAQNNCVEWLYFDRIMNKETHVVFVREKNNPEKSFITCEVSNEGNIIQYYLRNNRSVHEEKNPEAYAFRQEYQEFLKNQNW